MYYVRWLRYLFSSDDDDDDDDEDDDVGHELFCGMVNRRKAFSLISSRAIVIDPHHRESLTRGDQDLNLRRT